MCVTFARVSRHWNPDEELANRACPRHALDCELARRIAAEELARTQKRPLPEGSVAGLVLVAACCLAVGLSLYQFAGPRQVVERDVARR